jgi:uncharacterized lipoprotein NlpE involved in copper resistance
MMTRGKLAMRMMCVCAGVTLAGCGGSEEPRLMNLRGSNVGPDEFSILPTKPLTMPPDLAALPAPTPGGSNITDQDPFADAATALGGNAAVKNRASTDGGLVTYASRLGTQANIRTQLAAEDLEWRRTNDGRLLEKLVKANMYYRAYQPMSLDQYAELERWRALGVRTPSAPPAEDALAEQ